MNKRYTVPDEIVTAAGPEKSKRLLDVLLVLVPTVAIWHPVTAEGSGANLIMFWSWFYCLTGTPLNFLTLVIAVSPDGISSGVLLGACRRWRMSWAIPTAGLAWTLGAASRGWMWTAALLGACWVAGLIVRAGLVEAAKKELIKRHGPQDDAVEESP